MNPDPFRQQAPLPGPASVRAVIRTAEGDTPYVRLGKGPDLLLLRAAPSAHAEELPGAEQVAGGQELPGADDPTLARLALRFRVVAPLVPPPAGRDAAERWLKALIEGFGLQKPTLVADPRLAPVLTRFLLRGQSFVGAVCFMGEGDSPL